MMKEKEYQTVISADTRERFFDLKQIYEYRDLILLWLKKEWFAGYKQTILGPSWAIIQPIISTVVYTIIFGNIANLSAKGIPQFLFFMAGQIIWTYFSTSFNSIATTYIDNAYILRKVYFPRSILVIASLISKLISFIIHFVIFMILYLIIYGQGIDMKILYLPLVLLKLSLLAVGIGLILASLTSRYKDLYHMQGYIITLWMYFTPVVYDISFVPLKYYDLYMLNPVNTSILMMRHIFFDTGIPEIKYILISIILTMIILFIGIRSFKKTQKKFMDTI